MRRHGPSAFGSSVFCLEVFCLRVLRRASHGERHLLEAHPEVTFRLYLAGDLGLLVPELTELGWEVVLMRSPSIRYCPGGFWRFLALEEDTLPCAEPGFRFFRIASMAAGRHILPIVNAKKRRSKIR